MDRLISQFEVIRAIEKFVDNIFTKNMGDLINDIKNIPPAEPYKGMTREELRDYVDEQRTLDNIPYHVYSALIDGIDTLEQEPKTGHWFADERPESEREIICSNCEQPIFKYHKMDFDYRPKYCPNCGARMIEPQESEE